MKAKVKFSESDTTIESLIDLTKIEKLYNEIMPELYAGKYNDTKSLCDVIIAAKLNPYEIILLAMNVGSQATSRRNSLEELMEQMLASGPNQSTTKRKK